jgi:hypothetical protein
MERDENIKVEMMGKVEGFSTCHPYGIFLNFH